VTSAGAGAIDCRESGQALDRVLRGAPALVVQVRARGPAAHFSPDLAAGLESMPYQVVQALASPETTSAVGVAHPRLGEVLVYTRGTLVGRVPEDAEARADTMLGILRAALSPWVGRKGMAQWDEDESDPFTVIGAMKADSYEEVRAAWRRRLTAYHPDRFAWPRDNGRPRPGQDNGPLEAALEAIEKLRRP
jgi:hypothetical protein